MPADVHGDEIGAPEIPKPIIPFDCECLGYPGAMCGCWRKRKEES